MRQILKLLFIPPICYMISATLSVSGAEPELPVKKLENFINQLESFQAEFTQTIYGESGDKIEFASGLVKLEKPGKFFWEYQSPYNQKLISDGNIFWIYDIDLEQVTINDIDLSHGNSPASILAGNVDINSKYTVSDLGKLDGYQWLELSPLDTEQEFSAIRIGFVNNTLSGMVLFDNLGQTTVIQFGNIETNLSIDPGTFVYSAPDGIDIIDSRQVSISD
jgi:outer membrane lipoprotein carrier protein